MSLFDPTILAFIAGVYFLGSVVKGLIGFGALMIAVPVMSMVMEPAVAVALTSGPVIVSNVWQAIESRHIVWSLKKFWPLLLALVPATLVGSQFLATGDPRISGAVIGFMTLLFCALQVFRVRLDFAPRREAVFGPLVGGMAGLVGGATILAGSVLIVYLVALKLRKDAFVGAIALIYLFNGIPTYLTLVYFDRYQGDELLVSVGLLVPAVLGLRVGRMARDRISQATFQRLVTGLLAVVGVLLLGRLY